jgi:outer membrane protein assembly factor BamD (BamD/ComL family)
VLYERHGNRVEALRHYLALGYRPDYGYLIDCLMSEQELHTYLSRHPGDPHAKLIRYSIGYRQLRRGDYTGATRTFAALGDWLAVAEKKYKRETSHGYPEMPPLQVARALADLQRKEQRVKTAEEKARAAYAAAQLVFHQRHLVFYNGALWTGERTWVFGMNEPYNIQTRESQLSPDEREKLDRYQQEHTALFQAARMFERIVHDYPQTPEAPRALYSAALSYTLLPSVERYWNHSEAYTGKAIALYRKLIRDYPDDPLVPAAARYGGIVRKASR